MLEAGLDTLRTPRVGFGVPVLILFAAAGCGTEGERVRPDGAPDTARTATDTSVAPPEPATDPAAAADPEWTAGESRVDRPYAGAALLRDVRVARQDGYDRIVLDFGTDSVPSWHVAYIDRPVRECGSGEAVELAGGAWLSITVQPANAHTEAGEPTVRERAREPRLPSVLELRSTCDFEAMVVWVAGVASPERYRVLELSSPNRLVVDIRHAGAP